MTLKTCFYSIEFGFEFSKLFTRDNSGGHLYSLELENSTVLQVIVNLRRNLPQVFSHNSSLEHPTRYLHRPKSCTVTHENQQFHPTCRCHPNQSINDSLFDFHLLWQGREHFVR